MLTRKPIDMPFFYDIEATCWITDRTPSKALPEIVQIGMVHVTRDGLITYQMSTTVKPTEHLQLSSSCMELLHMEQSDVDRAEPLESVLLDVLRFAFRMEPDPVFYSWSLWDPRQLAGETDRKGFRDPRLTRLIATTEDFQEIVRRRLKPGVSKLEEVLRKLDVPFPGLPHSALADAMAMAVLYREKGLYPHE
jgi:inhibitor of KinA sporulation pathway (predicted exonuclease)